MNDNPTLAATNHRHRQSRLMRRARETRLGRVGPGDNTGGGKPWAKKKKAKKK